MIVVDTNVVAYIFLRGEFAARAEAWLKDDRDWAAPMLWRSEFRKLLGGYLRRKQLTFEAAREIQREAEALLRGSEHEVDSQRVLELVRDSECSAYDCVVCFRGHAFGNKAAHRGWEGTESFSRVHSAVFCGLIASRQNSSGGRAWLGNITKAGDPYLRSLLVMGARAVLNAAKNRGDAISRWAVSLAERRGYWRAFVAIAAKNARMTWAVLRRSEAFVMPS